MNDFFKEHINAWVYVNWQFWEEDSKGEWQESCYPFTLIEVGKFLHNEGSQLSQDAENIWFDIIDWSHKDDTQEEYIPKESVVYENELKALYTIHKNNGDDMLNCKSIMLSLEIPYYDTLTSCLIFSVPLADFFNMVIDQYLKPEVQVEDIPF